MVLCNYLSDYSAPQMRKSSIVISAFIHTPSPASVPLSASPPGPGKGATASERGDGKVSHGVVGNGDVRGRSTPIRLFCPCCSRLPSARARGRGNASSSSSTVSFPSRMFEEGPKENRRRRKRVGEREGGETRTISDSSFLSRCDVSNGGWLIFSP